MRIESRLKSFLEERRLAEGGQPISVKEPLLDSGILDSTGIFELVDFIEVSFGVQIADEEIVPEHFETIEAIAAFIESKMGG